MNRFSSAIANAIAGDQPWDAVLRGGKFMLFSGSVPASAEVVVPEAQHIMDLTVAGEAWAAIQEALMTVTLTDIAQGNTIRLSVGGIPIHPLFTAAGADTSVAATALALSINKSPYNMGVRAVAAANVVTLHAPFGTGALFNGAVVANGGAGGTVALSGAFAAGVDGTYGMTWERDGSVLNRLIKPAAEVWEGICPNTVVSPVPLTFFRYILDHGDTGISDDTVNQALRRWQGNIGGSASSTAQLTFPLVSSSVVDGVRLSINTFSFTIPLA
jgi:hypothetical protein